MKKNLLEVLSKSLDGEKSLSDVLVKKEDVVEEETEIVDTPEEEIQEDGVKRKFIIISSFGELLDVAIHLQDVEKEKVVFCVTEKDYQKIGDGLVEKDLDWHNYLGKGYIWVIDGCEQADLQDWLRDQGEDVVGTNKIMSDYEDNRQKGQELFRKAGFRQPESSNFTDIEEALNFIKENPYKRYILKQNGSAPKSINHMGKFDGGIDMIYHLEQLKKSWNEHEFGAFDCDLMEIVEGVEVAASAFFNGHDWLRNSAGKVVGFLNFEEKKQSNGNLGETTGETGTTFFGCDEDNEIFRDILLRPQITKVLSESNFRGVFDINGSVTDEGFVAFEPTSRFGIPATSYEFMEGLETKTADLLEAMACGYNQEINVKKGWGMCMVIFAKPYPAEADLPKEHTSVGEKLWILQDGNPIDDFTPKQKRKVHLENFCKDEDGNYKVATGNGYLFVVTGVGSSIPHTRKKLIKFIKENLYISGINYRTDIGERIEEFL